MRFLFPSVKIFFLSLLLILSFFSTITIAGNFNFNGDLRTSDNSDDTKSLSQNYNFSYSGNAVLTDTIDLKGSLRYSRSMTDRTSRDSSVSSSNDSAGISYSLTNDSDLYRLHFSNNFGWNKPSDGKMSKSWLWSVAFNSAWKRFFPPLTFTFSQNGAQTDSVTTAKNEDLTFGTKLDYLKWLTVAYSLNWNRRPARGSTDAEFVDLTQGLRHGYSYSFFANLLDVSYSLSWQQQQQKVSGGDAIAEIDAFQQKNWLRCPDNTPDDFDEPGTNIFISGCTIVSLPEPTTIDSPYLHLEFETKDRPGEFLNIISLFVESEGGEELQAVDYSWSLYRWNDDVNEWEVSLATVPVTVTPDTADPLGRRFRFDLDVGAEELTGDWFRLVLREVSPFAPEASITSITTNRLIIVSPGEEIKETRENRQARLSISMQPWKYTYFGYSVGYDRSRDATRRVSEILNNGASLTFNPSRYLSTTFSIGENRNMQEDSPDRISRSYALSLSSSPLNSLNVGITTSLSENYTGSELENRGASYGLRADARLYSDLSGNLNLNYSHDPDVRQSGSFSEKISLNARLRPSVSASLDQNYGRDTRSGATSHAINSSLGWRVSDLLQLRSSFGARWSTDEDMRFNFGLNMSVSPNYKNRGSLAYLFFNQGSSHSLNGNWAWRISRNLNFITDGSYATSQGSEHSWRVGASLRFSASL